MKSNRMLAAVRRLIAPGSNAVVGIMLALLWALHAAAGYVPGTGYFRLPLVLAGSVALIVWRFSTRGGARGNVNNSGITVGLCCWFVAATLSTIFNWSTEEVLFTYLVVFLAGLAVFIALSGITLTSTALDIAIVGLAAGALFPLIGGLVAFYGEWGTPDATTTITAWRDLLRMKSYTEATFGNRGNTAGFLLLVTPLLIATVLDGRRRLALRAFCGATLVPIVLNLVILQVRSAFLTLPVAFVAIWVFKLGVRRLPILIGCVVTGWLLLFTLAPDAGVMMTERLVPAVTIDTGGDESVQGRADAIQEGVGIFERNWLLGIGPGAALTVHSMASAHQFHVQEAMETGALGLIGSLVFSIGVFVSLLRAIGRGRGDERNDIRFMLLVGPAAFLLNAVIANAAWNNGSVNTWTVLMASMLALAPRFENAARYVPARAAARERRPLGVVAVGGNVPSEAPTC